MDTQDLHNHVGDECRNPEKEDRDDHGRCEWAPLRRRRQVKYRYHDSSQGQYSQHNYSRPQALWLRTITRSVLRQRKLSSDQNLFLLRFVPYAPVVDRTPLFAKPPGVEDMALRQGGGGREVPHTPIKFLLPNSLNLHIEFIAYSNVGPII